MYQPSQALTFDSAADALAEGLRAIAAGQTEIDLGRVGAVDSCAVAILLNWTRSARAQSAALRLVNPPENLVSLLGLYDLTDLLHDGPALIAPDTSLHH